MIIQTKSKVFNMAISQDADLVLKISSLQSRINRRVDSALSVHGISFTEFLVLMSLSQAPNMMLRRIELADSVGLTASGVTRLLSPMEKIGLIKKEENARDARVSLVKLTSAGKLLFKNAEKTINQVSEALVDALKENQKSKLLEVIGLML